jgi:hypothetical protein
MPALPPPKKAMKSSILKTRDRIHKAREHPRLLSRIYNLENSLREANAIVDRQEYLLGRLCSNRIDRNPITDTVTLCVSIEQRALDREPELAIEIGMRQLAQGFRQRARR